MDMQRLLLRDGAITKLSKQIDELLVNRSGHGDQPATATTFPPPGGSC
jgi:hypothetical protein